MKTITFGDILVITHNGKPVSEGGKRIGYQAKDTVFIIGGGTYSASALLAQQTQPKQVMEPTHMSLQRNTSRREFSHRGNGYQQDDTNVLPLGMITK